MWSNKKYRPEKEDYVKVVKLGNDVDSNLIQDVTSKIISNINDEKNKLITERLKKIVGIDLNIEEESKRRFKRLAIEYKGNEETIYFNDGSLDGIRIVTFLIKENPLTVEHGMYKINVSYSYY